MEFHHQQISQSDREVLNGEPTISVSNDEKYVWISWIDGSAFSEGSVYWRIKSARSVDWGNTWIYDEIAVPSATDQSYYFDPVSTYDADNNMMYMHGMEKNFSRIPREQVYIFQWDLNSNELNGPQIYSDQYHDKGWIEIDHEKNLWLVEHGGLKRSSGFGLPFNSINTNLSFDYSPSIKFDENGCIYIVTTKNLYKCLEDSSNNQLRIASRDDFSSLTLDNLGDYLPGTFRSLPLVSMAFKDGSLFVVYPDLESPESSDVSLWMKSSDNQGMSWSLPFMITPNINGDQFLPWFDIDERGDMHLIYYDTRHSYFNDSSHTLGYDVYYQRSQDNGLTWESIRLTPSTGEITNLPWGDYFFTDYIKLELSNNNVHAVYAWSDEPGELAINYVNIGEVVFNMNIPVTSDLNGSWHNPQTIGQGFTIQVLSNSKVIAYWYTYSIDGEDKRWFTLDGRIDKDQVIFNIYETNGGAYNTETEVETSSWGLAVLRFSSCAHANINIVSNDGLHDTNIELERLTVPNGNCQ
ncbi:MAG: sialidase family protein [Marinicella sp.]